MIIFISLKVNGLGKCYYVCFFISTYLLIFLTKKDATNDALCFYIALSGVL